MTKKKTLFKNISIFLCLVPMLVLSLFCLIPQKQDYIVAAADQVIVPFAFSGSNINLVASSFDSSGSFDMTTINNVQISFTYSDNSFSARIRGSFLRKTLTDYRTFDETILITSEWTDMRLNLVGSGGYYLFGKIYCPGLSITKDINRVRLCPYSTDGANNYGSEIRYYDVHDNYILFRFHATLNTSSTTLFNNFIFTDRTYYINTLISDDNVYYEEGYQDGYDAGLIDGSSSGYQDGYKAGETIGYGNGYNAGVEHGGNYTFMGLIGAVIDAPVSAFTSLLNFELLGVNILALITGLLSLAVIVLIVKLCMGGR